MCRQLVNPDVPKVKDMARWLNFLSYDCMGEMVFGRGFGMLTDPSLHYILDLIDSTVFSYLLVKTEFPSGITVADLGIRVAPYHYFTRRV